MHPQETANDGHNDKAQVIERQTTTHEKIVEVIGTATDITNATIDIGAEIVGSVASVGIATVGGIVKVLGKATGAIGRKRSARHQAV